MAIFQYKLFIDDERFPPDDDPCARWVIARNIKEVQATIEALGFPIYISFDHDLGGDEPSGHDIAKWIVETDLDGPVIPSGFDFYVHSQNPVGTENIEGLLRQYLKMKTS